MPSEPTSQVWNSLTRAYDEATAPRGGRFQGDAFKLSVEPEGGGREEASLRHRENAAMVELAERLVHDAHGAFMPRYDAEGKERTTVGRVRVMPVEERFFPGWVLDANQLLAMSGMKLPEEFSARLLQQVLVLPGHLDQDATLDELTRLMGGRVRDMEAWANNPMRTSNGYTRDMARDFAALIGEERKPELGTTSSETLELITEAAGNAQARTYAAAVLALEGMYAPVRVLATLGLSRERQRARALRGGAGTAEKRDEANVATAAYEYMRGVLLRPLEGSLSPELLLVAQEAIRRAITHLVVRYVTLARYVDYHSAGVPVGFRSQGLANKMLWWLIEYVEEGAERQEEEEEEEAEEESITRLQNRELESLQLSAKQLSTLTAALRWLERETIRAKADVDRELYGSEGAPVERQWWTQGVAGQDDMRRLAPQVATVQFLWVMKRVVRLYAEPTDYLKQKWAQDDFVKGGRRVYRPRLVASVRAFYENLTPYALAKAETFLREFTTNDTVPNTEVLLRFRDHQLCRRAAALSNVSYRQTVLSSVDRSRDQLLDARPTSRLEKQDEQDDEREVPPVDELTEMEVEQQGPEQPCLPGELVVEDTECMEVVFHREQRTELPNAWRVGRALLELARVLQDDGAHLDMGQFDFLLHHTLGTILPRQLFVAPVADLQQLHGELRAGITHPSYEKDSSVRRTPCPAGC